MSFIFSPSPRAQIRAAASLCLLAGSLVGCGLGVDNSGGEPPAGTDVSLEKRTELTDLEPCWGASQDEAALLDDEAAVDAWLADCQNDDTAPMRTALLDVINGLGAQERLVGVRVVLGGCVQQWSLFGIYHDIDALNVWVLKEDTSYGVPNAACTDDIGWDGDYWIAAEADFSEVTEATLTVGLYNPDLPGAPALPGG